MIKKLLFALLLISFAKGNSQNNYLDFDGIDDSVTVPNSDNLLSGATSITMSCKVYPKRISTGFPDFNGIMGYRNETSFDFYLIQLSSTDVEARFRNAGGVAYTITYTGLVLNQWTQFFLVYNGTNGTLKLYNGTNEVASVAAAGAVPVTNTGSLNIGVINFQDFSWYHKGYIDEASLWNKALSATEISAIVANSGAIANPSTQPNLKAYYKFDEGNAYGSNLSVTSLTDELGLHNGTLSNFSLTGNTSNWGGIPLAVPSFSKSNIAVYPNPATGFISISGLDNAENVTIYDISGRTVANQSVTSDSKIDIAKLESGVYFASINGFQNIRFIKN